MKRTLRSITVAFLLMAASMSSPSWAETPVPGQRHEQVIKPEITRRDVKVPAIDSENLEITGFAGVLNSEDFGSSLVYGARLAYHVTEDLFVEGTFGKSTVSDEAFRNFAISLFPDEEEDLYYYNLSLGFNAFPGEVFLGKDRVWSSSIYLITGVGNTHFNDEDFFTINAGFGVKLIPIDWISIRLDVRDHIFSSDLLGESKTTHNLEFTGNLGFFF